MRERGNTDFCYIALNESQKRCLRTIKIYFYLGCATLFPQSCHDTTMASTFQWYISLSWFKSMQLFWRHGCLELAPVCQSRAWTKIGVDRFQKLFHTCLRDIMCKQLCRCLLLIQKTALQSCVIWKCWETLFFAFLTRFTLQIGKICQVRGLF